ncbi:MAG TPA: aspartate/glutamate racemase family protein [Chitinophagaceae bacterium]|nr:aspartate/glutamate racemase family protein [Chitinophagaceae bacterium]HRG91895.1 aspartate/glutamate racemase family protein [Chitinophagaceae bacterium]
MKTIGLVGGLTWHSSVDYYRYFNQLVNQRLGGEEAAKIILNSVNFGTIKKLTLSDDWDGVADIIISAARKTVEAGADCILLGANTMHYIADRVAAAINVPLIHIADATAAAIRNQGLDTVALLGTKYTMQMDFYRDRLKENGIRALIPDEEGIRYINESIYSELDSGIFRDETRQRYLQIINQLMEEGAKGVILGCTEIPLLIKQEHVSIPVFDTAWWHAKAAVDFALAD